MSTATDRIRGLLNWVTTVSETGHTAHITEDTVPLIQADLAAVLDELTANTMALGSLEAEIEQAAVRVGVDLVGDDGERKGALQLLGEIVAALEKERAELYEFRAGWQSVFGKAD